MSVQVPFRRLARAGATDRAGELGQVLALVAIGLFVLIGAVALGVDGSRAFEERRAAQAAVDHAAMTAAFAECNGKITAQAIAAGLVAADRNGYDNDGTTNTVSITSLGSTTYRATIDSTIPGTFSQVIGLAEFDISVEATGGATGCGAGGDGPGAIYGGGHTCGSGGAPLVDVSGSTQEVYGGVHSSFTSRVGGSKNDFSDPADTLNDPFTYVTSHQENGSNNEYQPGYPAKVPLPDPRWPSGFDPGSADSASDQLFVDYRALAVANGTSFTSKVTDITKDGVYYTTSTDGMDIGKVTLPAGDANGEADVVLVAPNGPIKVSISGETFNPFGRTRTPPYAGLPRTGLLIVSGKVQDPNLKCNDYVISLSGGGSTWNGIIWGPGGLVEFNGSSNTAVNGTLIGWAVRLNGSSITITFDPTLFDEVPYYKLLK